ncbi:MAG: Fic family protein [Burkholderiales bacterium]|jgi:Fic family protein|nr:Fic family protein [Burkholderiales bacterium]
MKTPQWIWQQPDWPHFRFDLTALAPSLAAARNAQGKTQGMAVLLDPALSKEAFMLILTEDGMTTSAIEGEKLDLRSVRSSVARHLGLPVTGLPPVSRRVDGLVEVLLDATIGHTVPLDLPRLCGWQAALFPPDAFDTGLPNVRTGQLRGTEPMEVVSGPLTRRKVHFAAPPREDLENELQAFLTWFNNPPERLDGLFRAGLAHLWFVTIHPFEDGNGRLARAVTDMALSQSENLPTRLFSLSAQFLRQRHDYYAMLEKSQRGGLDVTPWLSWFLDQVTLAANAAEKTISDTLTKAKFWLRHQATDINERQRKTLNRLLDAGAEGFEGGIDTRKYVSLNKVSRATAYRELADLVEKSCLVSVGSGRSHKYEISLCA